MNKGGRDGRAGDHVLFARHPHGRRCDDINHVQHTPFPSCMLCFYSGFQNGCPRQKFISRFFHTHFTPRHPIRDCSYHSHFRGLSSRETIGFGADYNHIIVVFPGDDGCAPSPPAHPLSSPIPSELSSRLRPPFLCHPQSFLTFTTTRNRCVPSAAAGGK